MEVPSLVILGDEVRRLNEEACARIDALHVYARNRGSPFAVVLILKG